tara:strand:- start:89 stop:388 length:300 start_codon:yes stop_codon:yes gene_type:complete
MEDIKLVYDDKGNICNNNFPDISGWKDLSQPEIDVKIKEDSLNHLRNTRTQKLETTDWSQLEDVPEETKLKYKNYRQSLRDITIDYINVDSVVWPEEPK